MSSNVMETIELRMMVFEMSSDSLISCGLKQMQ